MTMTMAYLELRYSGGLSNSDQNSSLGGQMSSVTSQNSSSSNPLSGITIDYICGNTDGNDGSLYFNSSTTTLSWTPPSGGSVGSDVDISTDGRYVISDSSGDQQIYVTVVAASLPGGSDTDTLTITSPSNTTFDDIRKIEAWAGDNEYRCFYVTNTHPTEECVGVKVWINSQPTGADSLYLGASPEGVGNGTSTGVAELIGDEDTSPVNVTFSAPASQGVGILLGTGELFPGDCVAFWIKRSVPANTTVDTFDDISSIGISAYI